MRPLPTDFAPLIFSSSDLPERDRLPFWRDFIARKLSHVDVEMLADDPLVVAMTGYPLPGLLAVRGQYVSPMRLRRTPQIVAEGDDAFAFVVRRRGSVTLSQRRAEVSLGRGAAAVGILHAEPATAVISDYDSWTLLVPRRALAPLVGDVEKAAMRVIPQGNEALRLMTKYLEILWRGPPLEAPEARRLAATHVHDLIALALGATRDGMALAAGRGLRAARLRAVQADILENLADPKLSVAMIAHRQRVTPRYVHMLFELEGLTFSEFVLGERLVRAHRLLSDPRFAGLTISAVAFAAGFGDLSYFNRTFHRRFGATPSDVRCSRSIRSDLEPGGE
jgi:AraC-like DNA-binding protein